MEESLISSLLNTITYHPARNASSMVISTSTGRVWQKKRLEESKDLIPILEITELDLVNGLKLHSKENRHIGNRYPGDIDLFKNYSEYYNPNDVKLVLADKFKVAIKQIKSSENIHFEDFTAGYDCRYNMYLGFICKAGKIKDYNQNLITREVYSMYQQNLFTDEEYKDVNSFLLEIGSVPTMNEFVKLNVFFRNFRIPHWNIIEIVQGYKQLSGGKTLFLEDALVSGSMIKLDLLVPIEGRYTKLTNWYITTETDKNDNMIAISQHIGDYLEYIYLEIFKYKTNDPFKVIKRLWTTAIFKGEAKILTDLAPLFSSSASLYHQIVEDLKIYVKLITLDNPKNPKILYNYLYKEIKSMKERFSYLCDERVCNVEQVRMLENYINRIVEESLAVSLNTVNEFIILLQKLVDNYTLDFLDENRLKISELASKLR
jgi:hypothetical protein